MINKPLPFKDLNIRIFIITLLRGGGLVIRGLGYLADAELSVSMVGGPPHPVIVTIKDNKEYIRVLLDSYYTTITGWGVLLTYNPYKTLYDYITL